MVSGATLVNGTQLAPQQASWLGQRSRPRREATSVAW